jgi:hypothetical protein
VLHRTNTRFPDGMPLAREALMNEGLVVLYRLRRRAHAESLQTSLPERSRIALMPAFARAEFFIIWQLTRLLPRRQGRFRSRFDITTYIIRNIYRRQVY